MSHPSPGDEDYDWDEGPFVGRTVRIPLLDGRWIVKERIDGFEYWLTPWGNIRKRPMMREYIEGADEYIEGADEAPPSGTRPLNRRGAA